MNKQNNWSNQSLDLIELNSGELLEINGGILPALVIAGKVILSAKAVNACAAAGVTAGVAIGVAVYSKSKWLLKMELIKQFHEGFKSFFRSSPHSDLYAFALELGLVAGVTIGIIMYFKY